MHFDHSIRNNVPASRVTDYAEGILEPEQSDGVWNEDILSFYFAGR